MINYCMVAKVVYGPILWPICIGGALLNAFAAVVQMRDNFSSQSISVAAVNLLLTLQAAASLFYHDETQGEIDHKIVMRRKTYGLILLQV